MRKKNVSIIIPAFNESGYIENTLRQYQKQNYPSLEIIVVVNNSTDDTLEKAKKYTDRVLNFSENIGVSRARNEGAKVATGNLLVFSDADTYLTEGAIKKIADVTDANTITVPLGKAGDGGMRGKFFFFYKNLGHKLGLYKSPIFGVIACHRDTFLNIGGFNEKKKIAEYADFFKRIKEHKMKYKLITDSYAITSLRRFEKNGYLKEYLFWIQWRIASIFNKAKDMEDNYFNESHVKSERYTQKEYLKINYITRFISSFFLKS